MSSQAQREKKDHVEAVWLSLSPIIGQLTVALLLALVAMSLFVLLAHNVAEDETRQFDAAVLRLFVPYRGTFLFRVMTTISWLAGGGPQTVLVALTIAFFAFRKLWLEAGTLLLADVGGLGVIIGLKRLFHRPRPEEVFSHLGYSFPSGHTFMATTILGIAGYFLAREVPPSRRPWVWGGSVLGMFLVGWSRVYLEEHYPSDVGAGYAAAICWVYICLSVAGYVFAGRNAKKETST